MWPSGRIHVTKSYRRGVGRHQNEYYDTYSLPVKPLYPISSSYETQFLAQADCFYQILLQPSSETHLVSYPKTILVSYPNNKFSGNHSTESENLWSPNVIPVQRQFTFHPGTQYDWINNGGLTYKNTTHQNIIMHYLQFIFLNCTDVMPPTLPLIFRCLNKFQFPFTWWWKSDLLMSTCITHLSFYLLTKLLEF